MGRVMKASELAAKLLRLVERHGDLEVSGVFDGGHGGGDVDAFWYQCPYRGGAPQITIEVSEGGWDWARMPEEQWPPVDERGA
jgi:hypothetical protein